jgi:hypothetical protein
MSVEEIHVGDIGTIFRCTIYDDTTIVNIAPATSLKIIFKLPDTTVIEKTAELYTNGSDGILQYTTISGDLSLAGNWSMQAEITMSTGKWRSDIVKFHVYENL